MQRHIEGCGFSVERDVYRIVGAADTAIGAFSVNRIDGGGIDVGIGQDYRKFVCFYRGPSSMVTVVDGTPNPGGMGLRDAWRRMNVKKAAITRFKWTKQFCPEMGMATCFE
uniref:Uncharacterized protein n=1 Tax=Candidatus Kentrum sp. SD TaxID=2126332 RepID=A0A450YLZ6_9GAMM|nr:MAG: hypothetical protein BECKSD772F_GA0070984_10195 [Candidatus Kentron sp. SD]VFK42563.1 MAG: hypothetical protein BECKSD772E_GA0070983_10186 [Candidatus Kentron sp. SD]VFK77849.1 MAG: hypothetical protein BECKSD772D_GA0070982_10035 [Candidatus Kentron sp. SD]